MNATNGHSQWVDGNKKTKDIKRHRIVDSFGFVINVVTHSANIHDSVWAKKVFEKIVASKYDEPNLQHIFADASYRRNLKKWGRKKLNTSLTIVKRTDKS
ncbi:MAG: transposase [Pedobacter sp.]|nr:transposase [Chitinophagaceae bacterium]